MISIHVPLAGDDVGDDGEFVRQNVFLSTSPLRGTTQHFIDWDIVEKISIHVPLAGDDKDTSMAISDQIISIHVPLAGDDTGTHRLAFERNKFLSTSPLRGTTG